MACTQTVEGDGPDQTADLKIWLSLSAYIFVLSKVN